MEFITSIWNSIFCCVGLIGLLAAYIVHEMTH